MRRREEEARRRYSSSPMSDPMLESKLKKLVPSVILLQRQLISQLDGNVIRNTFYEVTEDLVYLKANFQDSYIISYHFLLLIFLLHHNILDILHKKHISINLIYTQ